MSYFDKSFPHRQIVVDRCTPEADNPDMIRRLNRIESNYSRLDDILTELEARFELDDRLPFNELDRLSAGDLPRQPR